MSNATNETVVEQRWLVQLPSQRSGVRTNKIDARLGIQFENGQAIVRDATKAERCRLCGYIVTKQPDAIIQQMTTAEAAMAEAKRAATASPEADEAKAPKGKASKKE